MGNLANARRAIDGGKVAATRMKFSGQSFKDRINVYACTPPLTPMSPLMKSGCMHWIVTIDRDTGVTPMFITCGNCGGMASSRMYKVDPSLKPTHEWFRPRGLDDFPIDQRTPGVFDHVQRGGLLLRPIGDGAWIAPTDEIRKFVEEEAERLKAVLRG